MFFALQLLSYIVTYVRMFQLVNTSNTYGGGYYNASAAVEVRWNRILDSKARNPTFDFTSPRYVTAYAETVFPFRFFVDGRNQSGALDLTTARGFYQRSQYPTGFYRRNGSYGLNEIGPDIDAVAAAHPISPGHNEGLGNYVLNPEDPGLTDVRSFSDFKQLSYKYCCARFLDLLSLYQAHKYHASFVVSQSQRASTSGSQRECCGVLQGDGRSIMPPGFPFWQIARRVSAKSDK